MQTRRAALVPLIGVASLLLLVLALPFLVNVNRFRPAIESEMTISLGRTVKIGDLTMSFWSGTVRASGLSIADDPAFGRRDFLRAKTLTFSIDLWPAVFSRKLNVKGVSIDAPETVLTQAASGTWNFSSLGAKTTSAQAESSRGANGNLAVSIKSLKINNARLVLAQAGAKPEIVDNVNAEVKDFAPNEVWAFSLSAKAAGVGEIALSGKAGPLDPADMARTPLTASLKITDLRLAASGAVSGASGIDGVVSADGAITSNGNAVQITGTLKAEHVKLAVHGTPARSPLTLDLALSEDVGRRSGQMSRGDFAIGSVKGSLTGTSSRQGNSPELHMIMAAPGIPVSGIEELLSALDIVLPAGSRLEGGTASATLRLTGPPSALVAAGPVSVRDTRLKGFDLGTKMSQIAALGGLKSGPSTEIQTLSANVRIAPEGTSLQEIRLVLPEIGELTGSGIVSPGHALNLRMRATVRPGALVSTLAPSIIGFSITGTASNPQFRPDVAQLAGEEIRQRLNGVKVGGIDAGSAADTVLQGLFGGKKNK